MKAISDDQERQGNDRGGSQLLLRPQQKISRTAISGALMLEVGEGMLAIDASPLKEQRQILDFMMVGDVLALSPLLTAASISIRAIVATRLVVTDAPVQMSDMTSQQQMQISRALLHQLMIGHLEAEARVASFLLAFALRSGGQFGSGLLLPLPMSRDDIADYLAMNRDTLSRIMTRLEASGMLHRVNRHSVRIVDLSRLGEKSPLTSQIAAACRSASVPRAGCDRLGA